MSICVLPPTNRDKWAIDPARTIVFVPDFPSRQASTALMIWLTQRFQFVQPFNKADVVAMRNTLARDIQRNFAKRFEWFAMFDNDMHPTQFSDVLFECKTDIACVQCEHGHGGVWARPDDFHCNGFIVNKKAATGIALPWFLKTYSEDGCEQTGCSCQHFRDKALAAGFTIQRGGWMIHGDVRP